MDGQIFAASEAVGARLAKGPARVGTFLDRCAILLIAIPTAVPPPRAESGLHAASLTMPLSAPRVTPAALGADPPTDVPGPPAVRRFTGRVGPDLSTARYVAGVPAQQGKEYVALLARAIPQAKGTVDDRLDLMVERPPAGSLEQLLYAGMDGITRADVELLKSTDGKQIIWVNADGVGSGGEASQAIRMPVAGRVSPPFGERFHPILGYARMYKGVDLAAAAGTTSVAAADGRTFSAGWHGGYGRAVLSTRRTRASDLWPHEPHCRLPARAGPPWPGHGLYRLDRSVDRSAPPFEVMKNGRAVNPRPVKMGFGSAQMEGAKLLAFQDELRAVLLVLEPGLNS